MNPLRVALVACTIVMTGCASLSTRVDILKSSYWSSATYMNQVEAERIAKAASEVRDGTFFTRSREIKSRIPPMIEQSAAREQKELDQQNANRIQIAMDATVDKSFRKQQRALRTLSRKSGRRRKADAEGEGNQSSKLFNDASEAYGKAIAEVSEGSLGLTLADRLKNEIATLPSRVATTENPLVPKGSAEKVDSSCALLAWRWRAHLQGPDCFGGPKCSKGLLGCSDR